MVEVTPHKDVDHKTGALCVELAAAAFGALANDYAVHMRGFLKGSVEKLIVQAPVHPSAQQSASS
jgi:hypothetical protein